MGALTGNYEDSAEAKIDGDRDQAVAPPEGKVETPVKGVFADAINKRDNLPVFKVSHDEFNQNMNYGRQRIRFKSGTDAQKFMQNSRYKQSFWIQHADTKYMRKIK
jgi:hypothetical protein